MKFCEEVNCIFPYGLYNGDKDRNGMELYFGMVHEKAGLETER